MRRTELPADRARHCEGPATLRPKRVLVFAPSFFPAVNAGGPARDLTNLVDALAPTMSVDVITSDRDHGSSTPFTGLSGRTIARGNARVHYLNADAIGGFLRRTRGVARGRFDIVLLNSIWNVPFAFVPAAMRVSGILRTSQMVLLPRGELEPGAMALKTRKKQSAMPLVTRVYRQAVDVCGATSESEQANISRWLPGVPTVMVSETPDSIPFGQPATESPVPRLLFLGRIHPTKGLLPALRALESTTARFVLDIAGPVEDIDYWMQCQDVARDLNPRVKVQYLGEAGREQIVQLLHDHDALLMLTAGENFGHVLAESLQAGCPVLATAATPWTSTLEAGGGWVVQDREDVGAVAGALEAMAAFSPQESAGHRLRTRKSYEEWAATRRGNIIEEVLALRG